MSDAFIKLPDDSANPGKQVDADNLTVNGQSVYRERIRISGAGASDLVEVKNTTPAGTEYGQITRPILPLNADGGINVHLKGDDVGSATDPNDFTAIVTQNTKILANGTVALTPKFAKIDRASNADGNAVVNIVSAKKIRVLRYAFVCAGAVSAKWQSSTSNSTGAGSNTDLTPYASFAANGGIAEGYCPLGLFETNVGEALKLNLNGAVQVSGNLTYVEV